jgi:hypothetical protein
MRRRESYAQFLLRVSQNFRAALPFSDELALPILNCLRCSPARTKPPSPGGYGAPSWQYHVTFNCFDGSAHMFLSFL